MRFYDVSGCRCEIVRPGTNLTAWTAKNKPFAVCNASLYDMRSRVPIGTIIEGGQLVHNDGNGYGFGICNGDPEFGQPWDRAWTDYLTGYNSPVQDGVYIAPGFKDDYVFNSRPVRIGIGRKQGKIYIVTDDFVTIREFANNAIADGFDTLVNLDGGGSRHLYYNGKTYYSSQRIPYNAIAFFNGKEPEKPKCPYAEPVRNLLLGYKGEDVKWLQWQLSRKGFACAVDGIFGWGTWKAVWNFQKTWSRTPDGICGANTRNHLIET